MCTWLPLRPRRGLPALGAGLQGSCSIDGGAGLGCSTLPQLQVMHQVFQHPPLHPAPGLPTNDVGWGEVPTGHRFLPASAGR